MLQKVDYVVVGAVDVEVVRQPVLKVTGWVLDLPPLSSFNFPPRPGNLKFSSDLG